MAGGDGQGGGPVRAAWAAVTVDCVEPRRVSEFWGCLLGVPIRAIDGLPGWFRLGPAVVHGPEITFQPVPEPKTGKARLHPDVWVDDLDAAVDLVGQLGGADTGETHAYDDGTVVVMSDPEGNEFCLVGAPQAQSGSPHRRRPR